MLAAYAQTANYVGEPELYEVAKAKLAAVDEALRAGAVAPTGERATAMGRLDEAIGQLDGALQALSELNGAHLQTAAASLARMGRRRNRWVFLLDGFAILAAIGATLLAARTVERYLATLARRARELEHLAIEVGHEIATPLVPIELALGTDEGSAGEPKHAGMARARRSVQRIKSSLERLTTFAASARPPEPPLPRTPLAPALETIAREAGLAVAADPAWAVCCPELSLQALLRDLFAAAGKIESVEVAEAGTSVRLSVARTPPGDRRSIRSIRSCTSPAAPTPGSICACRRCAAASRPAAVASACAASAAAIGCGSSCRSYDASRPAMRRNRRDRSGAPPPRTARRSRTACAGRRPSLPARASSRAPTR